MGRLCDERLSRLELGLVLLSMVAVRIAAEGRVPFLGWQPVVWCGAISYGLYVWSGLMPEMLRWLGPHVGRSVLPAEPGLPRLVTIVVPTLLLAATSWYGFERRISDLRRIVPYADRNHARGAADPGVYAAPQPCRGLVTSPR